MASKKGTPLSEIADFPAQVIGRLAEFWITTAEELVSTAVLEGGLAGLVTATGLPEEEVTRLVERAQAALPAGTSFAAGQVTPHGLGALDEREPGTGGGEEPASFSPLPESVDLHAQMAPIRNQGGRGTCVAFACTAVREYLMGAPQSTQSDLSEQFLYWDCKSADLLPGAGTFIRVGMNRLEVDGIPGETVWPYDPTPIPGNEGQAPPPSGAAQKAAANRIGGFTALIPTSIDALRRALSNGSPVAFSVPVYTSWFTEPTHSSGDVRLPLPGEKKEGGHAMCMVGYQADEAVPGGGYFVVRNSWGTDWACDSPVAAGYARLPFAYLSQYGTSAYTAQLAPEQPKSLWARFLDWVRHTFRFGYA
jgi:hypothetical protein